MKKLLMFLFCICHLSIIAQKKYYIPDKDLGKVLKYVHNDSIDSRMICYIHELILTNPEIYNLEGIQYLYNVKYLKISNSKIKSLKNLPPNLIHLDCSNNTITSIECLPSNLEILNCNNNKITKLPYLPKSLKTINCSNNLLNTFPVLHSEINFINYSSNPIPKNSLPVKYKYVECLNIKQNCLPWNIWIPLSNTIKDSVSDMKKMEVEISTRYRWGFGYKFEKIKFRKFKNELKATKTFVKIDNPIKNIRSSRKIKGDYTILMDSLNLFLNELRLAKKNIYIPTDNLYYDFRNFKHERSCFTSVIDGTYYDIQVEFFFSKGKSITFKHHFDSSFDTPTICDNNGSENLYSIMTWLYLYKFCNMAIPNHNLISLYFNKKKMTVVRMWYKKNNCN